MTFMLIDDELNHATQCIDALQHAGFEVIYAREGREALDQLSKEPLPDLILLDLWLPSMDAVEFRTRQMSDARLASVRTCATPPRSGWDDEISSSTEALLKHLRINCWLCRPFRSIDTLIRFVTEHIK